MRMYVYTCINLLVHRCIQKLYHISVGGVGQFVDPWWNRNRTTRNE